MDCCRDNASSTDRINSLEASSAKITPGVMTFENESSTVVDVLAPRAITLLPRTSFVQDITTHFSRPHPIRRGALATGARGRFEVLNFPLSISPVNDYPSGPNKVAFCAGIRYTLVFTLNVSASPFNQGLIAMSWQYASLSTAAVFDRALASQTATNLPHVRLDLSEETTVQLRVPFVASKEYASILQVDTFPYGFLSLNTLVNFDIPSGTSAPTYTLYYHLEDIELFGANPSGFANVVLQSGSEKSSSLNWEAIKASRAVSTILGAGGTIAAIASAVPTLTPIMGPTSWFLSTMSGVAATLGWSKPQICDSVSRMNPLQTIAENNVDLPSSTVVVGPLSTNRLGFDKSTTITDVDEMSVDFVKSQMSQLTIASYASTLNAGSNLMNVALCPASMWFRVRATGAQNSTMPPAIGTSTFRAFQPTSVMNLASYFKYWRGGFKFRVTFVKTKFHAGRVQFAVAYSAASWTERDMGVQKTLIGPTFGSAGPQGQGFNIVFNLKESNVCEFVVPYVSDMPYNNFFNPIGMLSAYVVDPLKVSGVVSTTVPMLVEVAGAEDFEVANYLGPWWPHVGVAATVDPYSQAALSDEPLLESPFSFEDVSPFESLPVLQSGCEVIDSLTPPSIVQNTIGEMIRSLKQLIMIPHTSERTAGSISQAASLQWLVQPWHWFPAYNTAIPSSWSTGTFAISGQIASCYAFVRGGTDVHIYAGDANQGSPYPVTFNVRQVQSINGLNTVTANARDGTASSNPIVYAGNTGVLHLRLPAFQNVTRIVSGILSYIQDWGCTRSDLGVTTGLVGVFPTTFYEVSADFMTYSSLKSNICAADDAYCHTYMGPTPFGLRGAGATGIYDVDAVYRDVPPPP